ncbi:MAG: GxxExxY protein [Saprospiraceae bacterium]|nr:GxxExxY protein [Saprospiraceae bacterium]
MTQNEIASVVFESALKIHRRLGPGLVESVYKECMYYEIKERGLHVEKQKGMPLIYEDIQFEVGYLMDLYIENQFVVEIKSIDTLHDVHLSQILTYLRLSESSLGMLINFNVPLIKDGVKRVINNKRKRVEPSKEKENGSKMGQDSK